MISLEQAPDPSSKGIEGVFSDGEKQRMIEKVTEAMVSVEGESLREKTIGILDEVKRIVHTSISSVRMVHEMHPTRAGNVVE